MKLIKNSSIKPHFHQILVWKKHNNIILFIKYSMRYPICDIINYCVWSCDMGEISAYMIKLKLKTRNR